MATYNVDITSKALKSLTAGLGFTSLGTRSWGASSNNLGQDLIAMHCDFDTTADRRAVRVVTHYLYNESGNWFLTGDGGSEMNERYIRVVVDVEAGSKTAERKEELLKRIVDVCVQYEGKKADECEFEAMVKEDWKGAGSFSLHENLEGARFEKSSASTHMY
ncbi:hypothetical protein LTR37_001649 [Vermiconidia calcicola]|uniref:Uncharacterized protein n=1 Tax=Vermiconidia calcicola TaxID=1690605 RepID=A0ACC3NVR6_9PEZI|nr:hypothetical protein LTR37_001649 [Vermiconidia calcicola]